MLPQFFYHQLSTFALKFTEFKEETKGPRNVKWVKIYLSNSAKNRVLIYNLLQFIFTSKIPLYNQMGFKEILCYQRIQNLKIKK